MTEYKFETVAGALARLDFLEETIRRARFILTDPNEAARQNIEAGKADGAGSPPYVLGRELRTLGLLTEPWTAWVRDGFVFVS